MFFRSRTRVVRGASVLAVAVGVCAAPGSALAASDPDRPMGQLPIPETQQCVEAPKGVALPAASCVVAGPTGGCVYVKGDGVVRFCGSTPGRPVLCSEGSVPVPGTDVTKGLLGRALPVTAPQGTTKSCVAIDPAGTCVDAAIALPLAQSTCLNLPTPDRPTTELCTATSAAPQLPAGAGDQAGLVSKVAFRNCTTLPGDSCTALAGAASTQLCVTGVPENPEVCLVTEARALKGLVNLPVSGTRLCAGVPAEPRDCVEDGLDHLASTPLAGAASGTVHTAVEPLLDGIVLDLSPHAVINVRLLVHRVNCGIVVPVEDVVDSVLTDAGL